MSGEQSLSEKIGTIVDCYLRRGTRNGAFGSLNDLGEGRYNVTVDQREFAVARGVHGWSVTYRGFEGIAANVEDAAYLTLEALSESAAA
jgi:hypothetical protein